MAGTYYNYAERNASDEINWAQIGKNVTDMLSDENKIRENKKAAIDKATREFGETLANAPQGEHQGINQWSLTYADNAQQARLMQDRLLKSGQLKPKDYFVMRQNINDGTTQAFGLIKEYQNEYKDKMDRYQKGDSQALEQWLMAEAEGFANFNNSELYINPTDFTVNVAKKEKQIVDGKEVYVMSKDPNDFTTVNAMRNRIKGKFNKLDVAKTLQGGVDVLGKDVDSIIKLGTLTKGGSITEIIDITKRKDFGVEAKEAVSLFERAEATYLDSIMSLPNNTSSVLTDYVNVDPETKKAYTYTWDAKKAGGNVILLKNDSAGRPVPEFTEGQTEVAKNALREKFRIMLDREVNIKATAQAQLQERRPKTAGEYGRETDIETAKNVAQNLVYSLTGNENESSAGTKYLSSSTGLPFTKTKEGYVVVDENGNEQTFKFKADGKTLANPTKFVKSFVGTISRKMGIREDDVLEEFDKLLPKGAQINLTTQATGFEEKPVTVEDISAKITPDLFTIKSEKSTENLNSILPSGFKATDIGGYTGNDVRVTAPNKKTYVYNANVTASEAESQKKSLAEFIKINSGGSAKAGGTGELD